MPSPQSLATSFVPVESLETEFQVPEFLAVQFDPEFVDVYICEGDVEELL